MSSLFVTGGGGFVGCHLLKALDFTRYEKVCVLHRERSVPTNATNVHHVRGELVDAQAYRGWLRQCDTVVHLAAVTGKAKRHEYFRVNADGTRLFVAECVAAGVRNFLHVSTIAVKFALPRYYYAQSKRLAEDSVLESGLHYATIRPGIIIGPQSPAFEGLSKLACAPVIPVLNGGRAVVHPVFVGDVVDCLLWILYNRKFDGQMIDLGGPNTMTIRQLLMKIRKVEGRVSAPVINLPVALVRPLVAFLEKAFFALMPLTAGQLTALSSDETMESNPYVEERRSQMKGIDEMLRLASHGVTPAA